MLSLHLTTTLSAVEKNQSVLYLQGHVVLRVGQALTLCRVYVIVQ